MGNLSTVFYLVNYKLVKHSMCTIDGLDNMILVFKHNYENYGCLSLTFRLTYCSENKTIVQFSQKENTQIRLYMFVYNNNPTIFSIILRFKKSELFKLFLVRTMKSLAR